MQNSSVKNAEQVFASSSLEALCEAATVRAAVPGAYAGEVTPMEAWHFMQQQECALVDVRTQPEWQFVGVPDVAGTKAKLHTISWKHYPNFALNSEFTQQLSAQMPDQNTPVFFLCRSGGRSMDAAIAMTSAGYRYCFNITDGFEGEPDATRHRGQSAGWKASQLPWVQG